jgi:glutathione synthase/RimK-type ligase-like ATP-grasp enzyme
LPVVRAYRLTVSPTPPFYTFIYRNICIYIIVFSHYEYFQIILENTDKKYDFDVVILKKTLSTRAMYLYITANRALGINKSHACIFTNDKYKLADNLNVV